MTWRDEAACQYVDPTLFFPPTLTHNLKSGRAYVDGQYDEARAICAECPVQPECLEYALETGPRYGLWAGYTASQLAKMRTRARR